MAKETVTEVEDFTNIIEREDTMRHLVLSFNELVKRVEMIEAVLSENPDVAAE